MPRIDFVTLFPDWIRETLSHSMMARASSSGLVEFRAISPRDYCYDQHKKVDDTPYGGHPGMLMKAEPVALAVEELLLVPLAPQRMGESTNRGSDSSTSDHASVACEQEPSIAIVFTEPSGIPFSQQWAKELANHDQVIFVCGHYEGIDHRAEEAFATHVFSIGDYVLTNGELPALVMADAVVRLLPGVLGAAESLEEDSFSTGMLSAPNYTKPPVWRGREVPPVLTNGDHKKIAKWREDQALERTKERRPDLLS